jgi:hypothetical protein
VIAEPAGGLYVRADSFAFRVDPGTSATVRLLATRFGKPYPQATVALTADPSQLQGGNGEPDVGEPASAIDFPAQVETGEDGWASAAIAASDPNNPRGYIDGQVYGVRPLLAETVGGNYPVNPFDFVSLLVWNAWAPDEPPTWWGSLEPIFQKYSNLYPIMDRFVDLADYESVCQYRVQLLLAFGLDMSDPNSMPVTRDLSTAKRAAILRWLADVGADGKPLLGTQPPEPAPGLEALAAQPRTAAPGAPNQVGKTLAASRRIGRTRE